MAVALVLANEVSALAVMLARLRFAFIDVQLTVLALEALGADAGRRLRVTVRSIRAFFHFAE